jgi:hypothetical protein
VVAVVAELLALMLMVVMVERPMVMVVVELLQMELLDQQTDQEILVELVVPVVQGMDLVVEVVLAVLVLLDLPPDKQQLLVVLE